MAQNDEAAAAEPAVFDLADALAVHGGTPVDATFAGIDFQIRRDFTGAEVLQVSEGALAGKGELIAEIVTTGCDPVVLTEAIEKQITNVASRLWGQMLTTAGIASQAGFSRQGE